MPRPIKSGVDYFPLDVYLDEKFELIEAEFGLTGFAVVVKLLQRIYGQNGYYCEWNDEVALLFGKRIGLGGSAVSEIVSASIRRGLFDQALYDRYHILTSSGIQKRYFEAVARRKVVNVERAYLLIDVTILPENVYINSENVNINPKIGYHNPQTKEEKMKGKESKVDDVVDTGNAAGVAEYLNKAFIRMTPGNWEALRETSESGGFSDDMIRFAIDQTVAIGSNRFSTIQKILDAWLFAGVKTLEAAKAHEAQRRAKPPRDDESGYRFLDDGG